MLYSYEKRILGSDLDEEQQNELIELGYQEIGQELPRLVEGSSIRNWNVDDEAFQDIIESTYLFSFYSPKSSFCVCKDLESAPTLIAEVPEKSLSLLRARCLLASVDDKTRKAAWVKRILTKKNSARKKKLKPKKQ